LPSKPGSSVGIGTDYGLDGPGSNPGGNEIFRPSRPVLGPNQSPVKWVPGLSWGRGGRDVGLTPHPHPESRGPRKSRAIPLLTPRAFVAYKNGETYLPGCLEILSSTTTGSLFSMKVISLRCWQFVWRVNEAHSADLLHPLRIEVGSDRRELPDKLRALYTKS